MPFQSSEGVISSTIPEIGEEPDDGVGDFT
jgi:hypothetical protein